MLPVVSRGERGDEELAAGRHRLLLLGMVGREGGRDFEAAMPPFVEGMHGGPLFVVVVDLGGRSADTREVGGGPTCWNWPIMRRLLFSKAFIRAPSRATA